MKKLIIILFATLGLAFCIYYMFLKQKTIIPGLQAAADKSVGELILCGSDEVFILDLGKALPGSVPSKLWTWKARERPELPDFMWDKFNTTDECKLVIGGEKILITSSGGGVALVARKSGKVSFFATATNAHSADILPGGRVAVAASVAEDGIGDRLIVYDIAVSGKEILSYRLPHGHGVVWDSKRQVLWALADTDIRVYQLQNWDSNSPSLKRIAVHQLPEGGGHDLYQVPGTSLLSVSTRHHCWLFDRDKHNFQPHPDLPDAERVKSIAVNPVSGQLVYVEAEGKEWWARRVHFLHPENVLYMPNEHFYKARWHYAN